MRSERRKQSMRRTSTPNLQWSRSGLDCGGGGKELASTRLSLLRSRSTNSNCWVPCWRACERGIGPPRKCGAFNLQKLAEVPTTQGALCKGGPRWPREGSLCGCWWAMREMELSTIRCSQVSFKAGPGCGSCTFGLPVSKTDSQALGKRRTHTCACSAAGGRSLCPVKTARDLHAAARSFARRGRITGHVCRVTGAQAMAVAGIELWLIQAFCRWGSRAVLECVRDCQLASANDLAVRVAKGVQLTEVRDSIYERLDCRVEPGMAVATERAFEEALEESVQGCSVLCRSQGWDLRGS